MPPSASEPAPIKWETVIVGSLFMLVALYFGYGVVQGYYEQQDAAASYLPIEATILDSKVSQQNLSDASGGGPTRTYQPYISYQYDVDGTPYHSSRYGYQGDYVYDNAADARRIVDRFRKGASVTAYYSPTEPDKSVLHRASPGFPVFIFFPVGFFLLGLVAAIAGLRGKFGGWKSNW